MRCKKHLSDCSSVAGVCASCLRERLLTIIEKQSGYEDELLVEPQTEDEHRKADAIYERVTFPRSVSPYVSRRKSDNTAVWPHVPLSGTPEIGANGMITKGQTCPRSTPMQATPQRRKQNQGLSFCLSPLVRARPSRSWNPKGGLPETVIQSGDMKGSPGRPGLSVAASSGANRSRKLANFGRFRSNY
ncbi:hypothetical protein ACET3Z_013586 [Daucus carota]